MPHFSIKTIEQTGFASISQDPLPDADEPDFVSITCSARGGRLRSDKTKLTSRMAPLEFGHGVGLTYEDAAIPAFAELIERSAAATFNEDQFVWSSADDLRERALDLSSIAKCSARELIDPYCSLTAPEKEAPIRWVKGLSLHDGLPIMVPAVMVYSGAGWRGRQERFWLPISTGCAAHVSYEKATESAICEVIERDAISITWHQQLPLPGINIDSPGPITRPYWERYVKCFGDIEYHFFDATTDLCVPTVYGIQISKNHPFARTIVACSTALSFDAAVAKVIKDLAAFKRTFKQRRDIPQDRKAFTGLLDSAAYMARPENASEFRFLLETTRKVQLSMLDHLEASLSLASILYQLKRLGMQVIVVDLTTDEAIRMGLRVVRVLIPELQPLSFHAAAQYLGHPRLYRAPTAMGYISKNELQLNSMPQPFA